MFCYKCGTELQDDAVFCSKCGVDLRSVGNNGNTAGKRDFGKSERFSRFTDIVKSTAKMAKASAEEMSKQGMAVARTIAAASVADNQPTLLGMVLNRMGVSSEELNTANARHIRISIEASPEDCARFPGKTTLQPLAYRNINNGETIIIDYPGAGVFPGCWYVRNAERLYELNRSAEAIPYLLEGASYGDTNCMAYLATQYATGFGVEQDLTRSYEWAEKGSAADHSVAKVCLAKHLSGSVPVEYLDAERAFSLFMDVTKNPVLPDYGFHWEMMYKLIGEMTIVTNMAGLIGEAHIQLAYMYGCGWGVGRDLSLANYHREQYYKASNSPKPPERETVLSSIAWQLSNEDFGMQALQKGRTFLQQPDDLEYAVRSLTGAAYCGVPEAMETLGHLYQSGINGHTRPDKASFWLSKASK